MTRPHDENVRSAKGEAEGTDDRRIHGGDRGPSSLATALAVDAMGYAIVALIRGAVRKSRPAPGIPLPDKIPPAAPAA